MGWEFLPPQDTGLQLFWKHGERGPEEDLFPLPALEFKRVPDVFRYDPAPNTVADSFYYLTWTEEGPRFIPGEGDAAPAWIVTDNHTR